MSHAAPRRAPAAEPAVAEHAAEPFRHEGEHSYTCTCTCARTHVDRASAPAPPYRAPPPLTYLLTARRPQSPGRSPARWPAPKPWPCPRPFQRPTHPFPTPQARCPLCYHRHSPRRSPRRSPARRLDGRRGRHQRSLPASSHALPRTSDCTLPDETRTQTLIRPQMKLMRYD